MATFRIEPSGTGSRVLIHTDLMLSGAVAQYGRGVGMIQATASQIIGQFAANLRKQLEDATVLRRATPHAGDRPRLPQARAPIPAAAPQRNRCRRCAQPDAAFASTGKTDFRPVADRPRFLAAARRAVRRRQRLGIIVADRVARDHDRHPHLAKSDRRSLPSFSRLPGSPARPASRISTRAAPFRWSSAIASAAAMTLMRDCSARYIGNHIPGSPSIIPQQMAGAGSLRAANYIYSVAPKRRLGVRHVFAQHGHFAAGR